MRRIAAALGTLWLVGCGGDDTPTHATETPVLVDSGANADGGSGKQMSDAGSITCEEPEAKIFQLLEDPSARACMSDGECGVLRVNFDCSQIEPHGFSVIDGDFPIASAQIGMATSFIASIESQYCAAYVQLSQTQGCGHVAGYPVLSRSYCIRGLCGAINDEPDDAGTASMTMLDASLDGG